MSDPKRFDDERYADYETRFDPLTYDRAARKARKPRAAAPHQDGAANLAELDVLEAGFETTYHPARFEAGWLLNSLRPFFEQGLISDVLGQVKGGKEASVYRCQAEPVAGGEFLAAKVYRPQALRNLRNDALYRQGREILTDGGRVVKRSDHRVIRAIHKKSDFGNQVRHYSWLLYEFVSLRNLHAAGADVPQVYAASDNALLMTYVGDGVRGAPTLHEADLEPDEARRLWRRVLRNVEIMLQQRVIHGDLSAFNILYWEGRITLIDFPQVIDPTVNRQARRILTRDLVRTAEYFQSMGVDCDPYAVADQLWQRYGVERDPETEALLAAQAEEEE